MIKKYFLFITLLFYHSSQLSSQSKNFIIHHKQITRLSKRNESGAPTNLIQEWRNLQKSIKKIEGDTINHLKAEDATLLQNIHSSLNEIFEAHKKKFEQDPNISANSFFDRDFNLYEELQLSLLQDLGFNPDKQSALVHNMRIALQSRYGQIKELTFSNGNFSKATILDAIKEAVRDFFTTLPLHQLITKNTETGRLSLGEMPQFYFVITYNDQSPNQITITTRFNAADYKTEELLSDDEKEEKMVTSTGLLSWLSWSSKK